MGAKSFQDLRTVEEIEYSSYEQAAFHVGLIDDNNECFLCLEEAVQYKMPSQLRHLFAFILVYC